MDSFLEDKKRYKGYTKISFLKGVLSRNRNTYYLRFLYILRKTEHYRGKNKILHAFYKRKLNVLNIKLNIEISEGCLGEGAFIGHGGIVINSDARIGPGATLYGCNCIGMKKHIADGCDGPRIGKNLSMGYGSSIIGNVTLGDNCTIGTGAVVNKSFGDNCILVGVPARDISKK